MIGFGQGGLLETAKHDETAVFFHKQTTSSLIAAIEYFEGRQQHFQPTVCRANALRFAPEKFRSQIVAFLTERFPKMFGDYQWPESAIS